MAEKKKAAVLSQLIELLEPLEEAVRLRTVQAAMTFLGSAQGVAFNGPGRSPQVGHSSPENKGGADETVPARAARWMQQNGLEMSTLESVFHFSNGEVEIIVSDVPGSEQKEKTIHCYL